MAADAEAKTPAKRGRPRKAACQQEEGAAKGQAAPQEDNATPGKATKRGRSKVQVDQKAEDKTEPGSTDEAQEPKKAKKSAAPKRDKNTPLHRAPTPRELEPATGSRTLRLISVNVAGLRAVLAGEKAKTLAALVEREKPDVLCINEHKLKEEDVASAEEQLRELLPKEYATMHWTCSTAKKGYSGVAMILRDTVEGHPVVIPEPASASVTPGMGEARKDDPIASQEGRLLTLDLPELVVVAVYVPNSGADLQRLEYRVDQKTGQCWDRAFGEYVCELREAKSKPVVVIGDMNCCADVRDIWNMHDRPDFPEGLSSKPIEEQYTGLTSLKKFAGLTPEERSSFPQMLSEAGLVDTFRALHPRATGVFSYFSQRIVQNRPMNKGLRLDYVLASSSLCTHLKPKSDEEAPQPQAGNDAPALRISDSFILDQDALIADHAAIGCHIVLPPA